MVDDNNSNNNKILKNKAKNEETQPFQVSPSTQKKKKKKGWVGEYSPPYSGWRHLDIVKVDVEKIF